MILSLNAFAAEVEQPAPKRNDPIEELFEIKDLMVALQDRLEDDRTDQLVIERGIDIEKRMQKLIDDQEDDEKNKKKQDKNSEDKSKTKNNKPNNESLKDSKLSSEKAWEVIAMSKVAWETRAYYDWVKMTEIRRDNIIQIYNNFDNIAPKWQERIRLYFLSVNLTTQANEKDMKEKQKWAREDRIREDKVKAGKYSEEYNIEEGNGGK